MDVFKFACDGRLPTNTGVIVDVVGPYMIVEGTAQDDGAWFVKRGASAGRYTSLQLAQDAVKIATDPLTSKGNEIKSNMEKEYGPEKGERVFYASRNKGTISGVDSLKGFLGSKGMSADDVAHACDLVGGGDCDR